MRGLTRAGEYADVAFTLHEGEVLGLTGLLGAGRTELALSLFGMTRPDAGEIRLEGQPIALATNQDAIRAGIAYLSEDRLNLGLNMRQSVGDNLVLASLDRLANGLGWIAPARRRALAADWVEKLHIKILACQPRAATLRRQPQRVVLGKWLATTPKILILDSPTVGVDIGNKRGIYELIRRLAEGGVGILLISDEVSEVFCNCDRCSTCATAGSSATWCRAPWPSTRWRRRSMRDLAARLTAHTEGLLSPGHPAPGRAAHGVEPLLPHAFQRRRPDRELFGDDGPGPGRVRRLVAGGIDISFAATASVAQYVTAYVATAWACRRRSASPWASW